MVYINKTYSRHGKSEEDTIDLCGSVGEHSDISFLFVTLIAISVCGNGTSIATDFSAGYASDLPPSNSRV